jgi:hypothetical protein
MHNKFAYWSEQHSKADKLKKKWEGIYEKSKDVAVLQRAWEAKEQDLKAKIQEAYIKNFWDTKVTIIYKEEKLEVVPSEAFDLFKEYEGDEIETRHKLKICENAISSLVMGVSWDKFEFNAGLGLPNQKPRESSNKF